MYFSFEKSASFVWDEREQERMKIAGFKTNKGLNFCCRWGTDLVWLHVEVSTLTEPPLFWERGTRCFVLRGDLLTQTPSLRLNLCISSTNNCTPASCLQKHFGSYVSFSLSVFFALIRKNPTLLCSSRAIREPLSGRAFSGSTPRPPGHPRILYE